MTYGSSVVFVGYWGFFPIKLIATISLTYCFKVTLNTIALTQSFNVLYARNTWGKKQNGILCDEWLLWRNIFNVLTYIKIRIRYITDLVCYTYFHWFFNPECQHIFGKQTGYIFQSPKTIKTWTTNHYASLNQWYNTG